MDGLNEDINALVIDSRDGEEVGFWKSLLEAGEVEGGALKIHFV